MPVFIKAVSSLSVVKVTVIVFFRWNGAFSLKIKTMGQWNILYREASRLEESWPVGKHFLKLKKMPSIALADLGTTAQPTSRAVAVIEKLVCQL